MKCLRASQTWRARVMVARIYGSRKDGERRAVVRISQCKAGQESVNCPAMRGEWRLDLRESSLYVGGIYDSQPEKFRQVEFAVLDVERKVLCKLADP